MTFPNEHVYIFCPKHNNLCVLAANDSKASRKEENRLQMDQNELYKGNI